MLQGLGHSAHAHGLHPGHECHSAKASGKRASVKASSKSGSQKAARGRGKMGRGAEVHPRKGPQARKRKGNVKRRTGHTRPRISGRKHKAIRKKLFGQALMIQLEHQCEEARQRRRRAWLALAWRLTRRVLRPMLLAPARQALRLAPQPRTTRAAGWASSHALPWGPQNSPAVAPETHDHHFEQCQGETVALRVAAVAACALSAMQLPGEADRATPETARLEVAARSYAAFARKEPAVPVMTAGALPHEPVERALLIRIA